MRYYTILAYGKQLDFDAAGAEVIWYESNMAVHFAAMKERK
jgi:hypothetical protein